VQVLLDVVLIPVKKPNLFRKEEISTNLPVVDLVLKHFQMQFFPLDTFRNEVAQAGEWSSPNKRYFRRKFRRQMFEI
jgi:hypothetical protein